MMKTKQILSLAALSLMAAATLTSCEDILGHWERPGAVTPTPSGSETPSEEAVNGKFSVADGRQVYFSKGNLQAKWDGSTWTWAFAEHQWDYIGGRSNGGSEPQTGNNYINGHGTLSASGTVDLFCWVATTSTVLTDAPAKYGITNSTTSSYFGSNPSDVLNDWGGLAISNTTDTGWRTLNKDEWKYLLDTRTTTSGYHYAEATVNGVKGVILLPDDWDESYYSLAERDMYSGSSDANVITAADWTGKLEAHGAVFLPAAGSRNTVSENVVVQKANSEIHYWSSSPNTTSYYLAYEVSGVSISDYRSRTNGCSVRLVRDVAE